MRRREVREEKLTACWVAKGRGPGQRRVREIVGRDAMGRRRHDQGRRRAETRDVWGPEGWSDLMVPQCGLGQIATLHLPWTCFFPRPNSGRQRNRDWGGRQPGGDSHLLSGAQRLGPSGSNYLGL